MKTGWSCLALLLWASIANADYLASNARITMVSNTQSNQERFFIRVTGGTGVCTGGATIVFKLANAGSEKIYDRAYAAALLAFSLGSLVNVYDYHDTSSCDHAESIQVSQ